MTDPNSTNPCTGCGTLWPLTERYYHRRAQTARGFQSRCRACRVTDQKRPLVLANMLAPEGHKACCRCLEPKPATTEYFYRSGYKDTLRGHCKACSDAEMREYLSEPGNRVRRTANKRDTDRRYYEENRKRVRDAQREYYRINAEVVKEAVRQRYLRIRFTPQHRDRKRADENKRRALKASAGGTFTPEEIARMHEDQGGLCAYCEKALDGTYHADHMTPLCRGGRNDWTNIALACPACNWSKHARTAEEFMEEIRST